jgi:hypothetical protein
MTEQSVHESTVNIAERPKKRRSRSQKIGRLKYNQYLLKRSVTMLKEVRDMQRVILTGLKGAGYFHFDVPMIQKISCEDQVDLEILQKVFESSRGGILPKDVAAAFPEYKLQGYQVTRRIQRMNKRLAHETGEQLFEKRGWKWALTSFGFEVWNKSETDL